MSTTAANGDWTGVGSHVVSSRDSRNASAAGGWGFAGNVVFDADPGSLCLPRRGRPRRRGRRGRDSRVQPPPAANAGPCRGETATPSADCCMRMALDLWRRVAPDQAGVQQAPPTTITSCTSRMRAWPQRRAGRCSTPERTVTKWNDSPMERSWRPHGARPNVRSRSAAAGCTHHAPTIGSVVVRIVFLCAGRLFIRTLRRAGRTVRRQAVLCG